MSNTPNIRARNSNREELRHTLDMISDHFIVDPESKLVGKIEIPSWNTTLLALSYVMESNSLILGSPGFGKTTAAKVIGSLLSGFPFDTYEAAQIDGHPDQTFETMIARPDFSKLLVKEDVIWLLNAYLPFRIIDEVNRLPGGKQTELLNALETGRFNYLGKTFFTGKTPFCATANNPDDGNHVIIPPLRDRFPIHMEMGYIGATRDDKILDSEENIEHDLKNEELTELILGIINDRDKSIKEKLKEIEATRDIYIGHLHKNDVDVHFFDKKQRKDTQEEICRIQLNAEARILLQMINAEMNMTGLYGRKRENDPVDEGNRGRTLSSSNTKTALSPRGINRGIKRYAQAIAYLTGAPEVTKEHIIAIAPYALGHRVDFTDKFRGLHQEDRREGLFGMPFETHLAKALVEEIDTKYRGGQIGDTTYIAIKPQVDLFLAAIQDKMNEEKDGDHKQVITPENVARLNQMIDDKESIIHPLLQEYAERFAKQFGKIDDTVWIEGLLENYSRYLQNGESLTETSVLTPGQLEKFLLKTAEYRVKEGFLKKTGEFVTRLIRESYLAGNSTFRLDLREIGPLEGLCAGLAGIESNPIKIMIEGDIGNDFGDKAQYLRVTDSSASREIGFPEKLPDHPNLPEIQDSNDL